MSNRKINMYEYRNIIYRLQKGQTVRSIAKDGRAGRNKIKEIKQVAILNGWLEDKTELPNEAELANIFKCKQEKNKNKSKIDPYAIEIEKWVNEGLPAKAIHKHLSQAYDFKGAYDCVARFVKKIKNNQPPELTVPLYFKPGEAAQVDFGQGPILYDERTKKNEKTWFFIMTLCWSRHQYAELVTHQDIETWLNCHKNAFDWFSGVPSKVTIDNPKCAITKACYHHPEVQRSYEEFAQGYGFIINALPPREPKKKGRVESGVKYVKNNFLPFTDFKNLQEANRALKLWVTGVAGNRTHGSTFKKPLNQFSEIEKYQLQALPTTPPEVSVWKKTSLYKDCHVRYLKCLYSAPYKLYGQSLWLKITAKTVSIYHEHKQQALHSRLFIHGERSTKQEHLPPNAKFYLERDPSWCLAESEKIGNKCKLIIENLLTDPVQDLLRQAQSIIGLKSTYGKARLENACHRAVIFNTYKYRTIKTILKEGLDYEKLNKQDGFEQLEDIYKGSAYYQRSSVYKHH